MAGSEGWHGSIDTHYFYKVTYSFSTLLLPFSADIYLTRSHDKIMLQLLSLLTAHVTWHNIRTQELASLEQSVL